jgi:hypothetical protein
LAEIFLSGLVGAVIGVVVGAFLRPLTVWGERQSRAMWGVKPVFVSVERDPAVLWGDKPDWQGFTVYVPDPIRLRDCDLSLDRDAWLRAMKSLGAVDACDTPLRITIQARVDAAVVIEGLRVIGHRSVELNEGVVISRPVGGADMTPQHYVVHLDGMSVPTVGWDPAGKEPRRPPAGYTLSAGEVERFHVWGRVGSDTSTAAWHEWALELDMLVEGRKHRYRIDDDGRPFITVAPGDLPWGWTRGDGVQWQDPYGSSGVT